MRYLGGKNFSALTEVVAFALVFGPVALAQPVTELWSQTYTGEGPSRATGVAVHNGAVYAAGWTTTAGGDLDMLLLKYELAGNPVWERTWGGSNSDYGAEIAPQGNDLYVCGSTRSYAYDLAGGLEDDAITVKWTEDGVYDTTNSPDGWWTRFSGDADYWGADHATNVAVDTNGNAYVVGSSERGWGNPWGYAEQYDSAGVKQWHDHFGTSGPYLLSGLVGLVLSGEYVYTSGVNIDGSGDYQLVVRKYTTGGALEWEYTWGDAAINEQGLSIVVSGNDMYVAGQTGSGGFLLVKLHDDGTYATFVDSATYPTPGVAGATEVKLVGGTLYVVGDTDVGGNTDSLLAAYDTDLNLLWDYLWGGTGDDTALGLAVHEGVIYVAGMENGNAEAYVSAFMLREAMIPAVSEWGVVAMTLFGLAAGTIMFRQARRRAFAN